MRTSGLGLRWAAKASVVMWMAGCAEPAIDKPLVPDTPSVPSTPTVVSVEPRDDAAGVSTDPTITLVFSEPMSTAKVPMFVVEASQLDDDTRDMVVVDAVWTNDTTATGPVKTSLAYDTTYAIVLQPGTESAKGVPPDLEETWQFSTASPPYPTLLEMTPANGSTRASVWDPIVVVFSEFIDPNSVDDDTFQVQVEGGDRIYGDFDVDGETITFVPSPRLPTNARVLVTLTRGIESEDGWSPQREVTQYFDTIEPIQLVSVYPPNGATDVPIDTPLTLTFSAEIDADTVNDDSVRPTASQRFRDQYGATVPGAVTISGNTLQFVPDGGVWQEYETTFTTRLAYDVVRGLDGQPLERSFEPTFRTLFVDPAFLYRLHTEGQGRLTQLDTFSGSYQAFMGTGNTSGSYWYFADVGGWIGARNTYGGDSLWLDGGIDGEWAYLGDTPSPTGVYSDQQWRFDSYGNHGPGFVQEDGESPSVYYMKSARYGDDLALKTAYDSLNAVHVASMQPPSGSIYQLWWLERMGRR